VRRALLISLMLTLVWTALAAAGTPYAIQGGYEELDQTGERVRAVRIPLYFTLRHWDDRPFGLRLRLAGTFAVNDLEEVLDGDLEQVQMVSFMPGLEFVIPFGRNHMLRPFLDMGVGTENQTDKEVLIVDGGLRTEFIFARHHFFYGLEPGFQVSSRTGTDLIDESVFNPFVTLTARRVLGFTIDKHQPDGELYFEAGYDFNTFELSSVRSTNDAINTNIEVGLGFGFSQTRQKIWFFTLPRVRVGYRFGDLEGWRIRFGGDWLTRVVGLNTPG
jgi:hypothetical protein